MTTKQNYSREECEALANMVKAQPPATPLRRLTEAEAKENMRGAYDEHGRYVEHISERKSQPPAAPAQASLVWAPYMTQAKAVATDAQLSGDVGVIARLLQERDQARAELDDANSVIVAEATKLAQARADLQTAADYISELEEFKAEAVKTSERQLVAFQTERGVAMEKESEIRKLRAQAELYERALKLQKEATLEARAQAEATSHVVADLLEATNNLLDALGEAQSTTDTLDAIDDNLPAIRAAIARAEKA